MPLKAPTKGLAQLQLDLKELGKEGFLARTRLLVANKSLKLSKDCFFQQKAPEGTPWPPRTKDYPHPMLRDTKKLFNGTRSRALKRSIKLYNNVAYARIHNQGGSIKHHARSELRYYSSKGNRISMKRAASQKKSHLTKTSIGEGMSVIPARPFIPHESELPKRWATEFNKIFADQVSRRIKSKQIQEAAKRAKNSLRAREAGSPAMTAARVLGRGKKK